MCCPKQKRKQDLRFLLAAIPTSGLHMLWNAFKRNCVIRGRFVNDDDDGCLFHWLSERYVRDRATRIQWAASNILFTEKHERILRMIIAGWDAYDPNSIIKGNDYEKEYPKPSYIVMEVHVRNAMRYVMRERRKANAAERAVRRGMKRVAHV